MDKNRPKPVVLAILDGWGVAPPGEGNAITEAKTPVWHRLIATYPTMTLKASGEEVGLSFGEIGTSEVGHLNLGSGKIIYQNLPRLNKSIRDGEFFKNEALNQAMKNAKEGGRSLHLMGLTSEGGVHSHTNHLYALLDLVKNYDLKKVFIHCFLDGRDTIYNVGLNHIKILQKTLKEKYKFAKIASLAGRFYAMDRDNHWDRTEAAYLAIAEGKSAEYFTDPAKAIQSFYDKNIFDEQLSPVVIGKEGKPTTKVEDGDSIIFFNFRSDRARQLTKAFVLPDFVKFERQYLPNLFFVTMMEYEKDLPVKVAFYPEEITASLAKVISDNGLKQFHIAESEKYAHVTFFFNGLSDKVYPGEDRVVIPSPRVSSFEEAPEMSSEKIIDRIIKELKTNKYDFIVVNFANADMVGHTANKAATIKAVETIDDCLGKLTDVVLARDGVVLITADHGNAEELLNLQTNEIDKEHSTNPVPFIIVGQRWEGTNAGLPDGAGDDLSLIPPVGVLSDVAPTILKIMNLPQPPEMTGAPLI